MQFRLRTLLIVLTILPPLVAPLGVWAWREHVAWRNSRSDAPTPYFGAILDDKSPLATLDDGGGVIVLSVKPASPAEAGGLLTEDVIVAINNRPCHNLDDFDAELARSVIGSRLAMKINCSRGTKSLTVTLGKRPSAQ